jgi:hypothetical protein
MDEILQDERFKHIAKDQRFKNMPRNERKFKVDQRFKVKPRFKKYNKSGIDRVSSSFLVLLENVPRQKVQAQVFGRQTRQAN